MEKPNICTFVTRNAITYIYVYKNVGKYMLPQNSKNM